MGNTAKHMLTASPPPRIDDGAPRKALAINRWQLLVDACAHAIALRAVYGLPTDADHLVKGLAHDAAGADAENAEMRGLIWSAYPLAQDAARPIIERAMAFAKREGL